MKCDDCKVDLISTTVDTKTEDGWRSLSLLIPNEQHNEELVEFETLEKELIEFEYDGNENRFRDDLGAYAWDHKPEYLELLEELKEDRCVDIIAKVCPKCGEVKVVADLIGRRKKMTQLKRGVKNVLGKARERKKSEERENKEKAKKDREIAKLKKQIEELGGDS